MGFYFIFVTVVGLWRSVLCCNGTCESELWRALIDEFSHADLVPTVVATVNQICKLQMSERKRPFCGYSIKIPDGIIEDRAGCVTLRFSGVELLEDSGVVVLRRESANDQTSPFNATVSLQFSFVEFSLVYSSCGTEKVYRFADNLFGVSFTDSFFDEDRLGRYECLFHWHHVKIFKFVLKTPHPPDVRTLLDKDRLERALNGRVFKGYLDRYVTPCNGNSLLHSVGNRFSERVEYEAQYPVDALEAVCEKDS